MCMYVCMSLFMYVSCCYIRATSRHPKRARLRNIIVTIPTIGVHGKFEDQKGYRISDDCQQNRTDLKKKKEEIEMESQDVQQLTNRED